MEKKYAKIDQDSKSASRLLDQLSFLSADDLQLKFVAQMFDKKIPNPPLELSIEFQQTLKLLQKHSAIKLTDHFQLNSNIKIDNEFQTFLRDNVQRNDPDCVCVLELSSIFATVIFSGQHLSFSIIPHVEVLKKGLKAGFRGGHSDTPLSIRIKCWWMSRRIGRTAALKVLDNCVSTKIDHIYERHIQNLVFTARGQDIIQNNGICQPSEEIHKITLTDYSSWILDKMIQWGQRCPKILEAGVKTLGGLGRRNILPKDLKKEIFDYAIAYEEDGWDIFICCLVKTPFAMRHTEEMKRLFEDFIEKLTLEFERLDKEKQLDRWKRIWGTLKELLDDQSTGRIMKLELSKRKGQKMMAKALSVNEFKVDMKGWAKSQGIALEIGQEVFQRTQIDYSVELIQSKKFLIQINSFLSNFLQQFRDKILGLTAWKIIEPYFGLVMEISKNPTTLRKLVDLQFFGSLKSALQIIDKLPPCLAEESLKEKYRLFVFSMIFCTLVKLNDKNRVQNILNDFKGDLEKFEGRGKLDSRTWPWPSYWKDPLMKFASDHKSSAQGTVPYLAVQISHKILEGLQDS